jgi:hypothetical protein
MHIGNCKSLPHSGISYGLDILQEKYHEMRENEGFFNPK